MNTTIKNYYKDYNVMYALIKSTYNREFAMLVPSWRDNIEFKFNTRNLRCHNFQGLKYVMDGLFLKKDQKYYNLYYSLAQYKEGVPFSSIKDLATRETTQWNINHWKSMIKYDFVIDIDAGDYEDMKWATMSMQEIHTFLDLCNCPHEVIFSGKGFHIIIDYDYFQYAGLSFDPKSPISVYKYFQKLAKHFNERFTEMIDLNIYDSRRVLKLPYSLAIYEDNVQVCRPLLNNNDVMSFDYDPDNKHIEPLKQRGRNVFNVDGNVSNMLRKMEMM